MDLAGDEFTAADSGGPNGISANGLREDPLAVSTSPNPPVGVVDTSSGNDPEVDTNANADKVSARDDFADLAVGKFGDEEDTDEDDDTVNVIIKPSKGSIYKTGTTYQARSQQAGAQGQKALRPGININDPGSIQGVPTIEFNISSLGEDDKPWKRPGADITDYFNYGFTEDTWLQYCEKQKILRQEYANTALKPVLVGSSASFGLTNISGSHRGSMRFPQQQQLQNKDIHVLSGRGRSPSVSDEELEKRNGLLGSSQAFNIPPPCFAPPTGGDALSQFGNVANALSFPPPGFTNTSVPPPLLGTGFSSQQPGHQWPQSNIGGGLLPLFPNQSVRTTGGRNHHSDNRRDRTPENQFSEEELNDCRRTRYRGEEEQEGRYDRDHRLNRRSRSRSRDYHYGGRSRRYHDESSRDFGRHGERSSRRRISRERRRDRSRERSRERDHSLVPSVSASGGVPGGTTTGSAIESGASRSTRSGESRRRNERESHRSHHRHRRTSRHRSPSCQNSRPEPTESVDSQLSALPSQSIDPLEAASAAAADISEKIRRASASDGVSG